MWCFEDDRFYNGVIIRITFLIQGRNCFKNYNPPFFRGPTLDKRTHEDRIPSNLPTISCAKFAFLKTPNIFSIRFACRA